MAFSPLCAAIIVAISICFHVFLKQFWLASVAATIASTWASLLIMSAMVGFRVNIAWLPFQFMLTLTNSFPLVLLIGLQFWLYRRAAVRQG